jgi:hypothetical protein
MLSESKRGNVASLRSSVLLPHRQRNLPGKNLHQHHREDRAKVELIVLDKQMLRRLLKSQLKQSSWHLSKL